MDETKWFFEALGGWSGVAGVALLVAVLILFFGNNWWFRFTAWRNSRQTPALPPVDDSQLFNSALLAKGALYSSWNDTLHELKEALEGLKTMKPNYYAYLPGNAIPGVRNYTEAEFNEVRRIFQSKIETAKSKFKQLCQQTNEMDDYNKFIAIYDAVDLIEERENGDFESPQFSAIYDAVYGVLDRLD